MGREHSHSNGPQNDVYSIGWDTHVCKRTFACQSEITWKMVHPESEHTHQITSINNFKACIFCMQVRESSKLYSLKSGTESFAFLFATLNCGGFSQS